MTRPLILITNDDSYKSKGIRALAESVQQLGDVIVVAPIHPNSGMSSAITVSSPLRLFIKKNTQNLSVYVCNGTPVDCVKLAFNVLLKDRRPDIILSGINHGSNSAVSVLYSGTMGAAIEGCLKGVSSIGFSLNDHSLDADFTGAQTICKQITEKVLAKKLPVGTCLNVNIPATNKIKGIRIARQTRGFWENEFKKSEDGASREVYWLTGSFSNSEENEEDTDEYVLDHQYVSVVPVKIDMTDYESVKSLENWNIDF